MIHPDPTSIPGPHDIVRRKLENGITILVRENHSAPTVIINGLLRAGAIDTPADKAGLASLTSSALLRGAGKRSFAQLFADIESVGASLAFGSLQHTTEFHGRCLADDIDLLLDIVRDALYAPAFPAEQLERLRGETITGLQVRMHDTRYVAGRTFYELAYPPEHPYSRDPVGTLQTVGAVTRKEIVNFHWGHYGPQGMIISVVGDVDAETIVHKLTDRLGNWSAAPDAPRQPELPSLPEWAEVRERFVPMPGKTQADIVLGRAGPPRAAEDFLHARLANTILGVFGMMGRLGANVRDQQGLAYYVYSGLQGGLGPGPWLVRAGVNPANVQQAITSIRDEIRRLLAEPLPADELTDNKRFMIGSMPILLETNAGVASSILDMELYQLGLDYLQRYPELISAITAEQVQAAARKYLNPDEYALAVAGPALEEG